jgi:DNA polymerase I-like protein with 3'-5' exonuclease and polymerase domains
MRPVAVQDFRRALRESAFPEIRKPSWSFVTAPTLADAKDWLRPMIERQTPLVADIEGWGVVDDIGFACSATEAICIPFVREEGGVAPYWGEDDAVEVLGICIEALSTCPITFHNAIFDMQVLCRRWGVAPKLTDDTMVMQHVLFPGMLGGKIDPTTGKVDKKGSSLSLSFIASMYCEYYRYWKDDGRVRDGDYDDQTYWRYNCEDCVRTFECRETLSNALRATNLWEQYRFEMSLFGPVLDMMFRGLRCDQTRVKALRAYTDKHLTAEESWLTESLGFPLNVGSAPQMHALFYEDLGCAVSRRRRPRTHRSPSPTPPPALPQNPKHPWAQCQRPNLHQCV